jgi:hypothetical protein
MGDCVALESRLERLCFGLETEGRGTAPNGDEYVIRPTMFGSCVNWARLRPTSDPAAPEVHVDPTFHVTVNNDGRRAAIAAAVEDARAIARGGVEK